MRVFHIITHFDLGGAERVAANIAMSATKGMEYHIVEVVRGSSQYTPKFIFELQCAGIRCHRSLMPDISFHFLLERIAALLFPLRFIFIYMRWHPDIIHVHTETADMSIYAFSRAFPWLRRHRIVRTIHNTRLWTGLPRLAKAIEPFFISRRANVAISASVRDSYGARFGQKAPIIYNGVPETPQKPYPFIDKSRTNILFAGRMEAQKGIDTMIEVVKRMQFCDDYLFHIMGNGSMREKVEQALGKLPNVRITDAVYALPSLLSSFDYLFMPSEFEGLSMLSMEASINGLPVIANDCPGLGDTLPPSWRLKVQGNSVEAYMHIFRSVLPAADRAVLVSEARQFALRHFTIRLMQQHYEDFYRSLLHDVGNNVPLQQERLC